MSGFVKKGLGDPVQLTGNFREGEGQVQGFGRDDGSVDFAGIVGNHRLPRSGVQQQSGHRSGTTPIQIFCVGVDLVQVTGADGRGIGVLKRII